MSTAADFSGLEMTHFLTFFKSLKVQQERRKVRAKESCGHTDREGTLSFSSSPPPPLKRGEKLPPCLLLSSSCPVFICLFIHTLVSCWIPGTLLDFGIMRQTRPGAAETCVSVQCQKQIKGGTPVLRLSMAPASLGCL